MVDDDRQQWLRHMESVQWSSITIFTTLVAGLFAYSVQNKSVMLSGVGLLFTNLTLYFAAGFRASRRFLSLRVEDLELAELLATKGRAIRPSMWSMFVFSYALIDGLWVNSLIGELRLPYLVPVVLACVGAVAYSARMGRGLSLDEWNANRPRPAPDTPTDNQ